MDQDVSVIHPLALAFTILAGILMLALPRRSAIVPLMLGVVFIPQNQRLVIASLDFYILRLLVIFGWTRVLMRAEHMSVKLNTIDKLMIMWAVSEVTAYTLLWQTGQAFINRLGLSFDILGIYFLIRFLVRDYDDIIWTIKTFALISLPVAAFILVERETGRNLFSIFGGVPEFTPMRDGRLRCQGAFAHPITAGTFGATMFPIFYSLRKLKTGSRFFFTAAAGAAFIIMINSASSGPALAFMMGIFGLFLWRFRAYMRVIRWGLVFSLIFLHIIMKAPVWALLMKFKVFGSSTAYHRYHLFDQFVKRFGEWWLVGVKTTANWGYYLFDVTNMFIRVAVDGGLATLIIFIAIISYCFQTIGRAVKASPDKVPMQTILWALGASLFAHVVSFFGVSYWDQIKVVLYMLFALIATVRSLSEQPAKNTEPAVSPAIRPILNR